MTTTLPRKLAAILAADAANFSGKMNADETGTFAALAQARQVIDGVIAAHGGRVASTAGDGLIAEFPSVNGAVKAAVNIQQSLGQQAPLPFRIGVHMGDVIEHDGDLLGDGVNLAARLQAAAAPGGVVVSAQVHDQVDGKLSYDFPRLGSLELKHIPHPIEAFGVAAPGLPEPFIDSLKKAHAPSVAPGPERWVPKAWHLAAAWGTLALTSIIADLDSVLRWIGMLGMLVVVFRMLPTLGLSGQRHIKWILPVVTVVITRATLGSGWFWLALPLVMAATLMVLRMLKPQR